jgi:hypothetical protein
MDIQRTLLTVRRIAVVDFLFHCVVVLRKWTRGSELGVERGRVVEEMQVFKWCEIALHDQQRQHRFPASHELE